MRSHGIEWVDWPKFNTLATQALSQGATFKRISIEWDVSMGCLKPYFVTIGSYKMEPWRYMKPIIQPAGSEFGYWYCSVPQEKVQVPLNMARYLDMWTPCRKCEECLKNRRKYWASRARQEINRSTRTWFGTLTINPHWRFVLSARSGKKDFHHSYREVGKEVTKYFKRLRKAGHKFRYLLVMEAHKDGYPHVHLFVHEGSTPIPKRELQSQWKLGFTDFKLVDKIDNNAARYVTKYLAKDARSRIRGSQKYGLSSPV